jgi:mono/diheme cytochrome c family protein
MRAVGIGLVLMCAASVVAAQQEPSTPSGPALVPQSLVGSTSFDLYCASCHGRGGTGDGPVASALRIRPADLTQLARRHNGTFPRAQVRAFIEGTDRQPPAHGSSEMPVWGPTFRGLETSDARVKVRLDNLVAYIESIQAVPSAPAATEADGAALFRSYCASCHGVNGKGDGPMAGQLRQMPADLTRFATRNGGVFPEAKVARIVDGRDVAAHGASDMPVWGNVFKRAPDGDAARVRARIAAIVTFLASIQQRPAE